MPAIHVYSIYICVVLCSNDYENFICIHVHVQQHVYPSAVDGRTIVAAVLAVFINVFFFIVLPITICICICCCIRYQKKRARRSVVTRVMSSNPSSRGTTVMTLNQRHTPVASSNQVTSSFNFSAAVPYPQDPVYKDAQLSSQDAPPSYCEATAYPAIDAQQAPAQVHL